jgi:hypothetical protein
VKQTLVEILLSVPKVQVIPRRIARAAAQLNALAADDGVLGNHGFDNPLLPWPHLVVHAVDLPANNLIARPKFSGANDLYL